MKKLFYILLLISGCVNAQFRPFFRQNDNTIHFGANLQGLSASDEIRFIRDSLHWDWIRDAVTLSAYTTGIDNGLQQRYNAGMHIIYNINWGAGAQPRDFPTGATLISFQSKLQTFLQFNWQFLVDGIIVIENEPYNSHFYNWTDHAPFVNVAQYIAELSAAITICRQYNLKVVDGATHLNYYSNLINPPITNDAAKRADTAFNYYANLQMSFDNYHFDSPSNIASPNALDPNIILTSVTYGTGRTGHNYVSNEWHQEAVGTSSDWNLLAGSIVTQTRQSHIRVAVVFGGDGHSDALPLVDVSTLKLTSLGIAYRDAVTPQPN